MIPLTAPTQKRLYSVHDHIPQAPSRHGTPYVAVDDPSEEAALQYMGSSSSRRIENVRPPAHSLPPKLPPSALAALTSGKTTPRPRQPGVRVSPRLQAYQGWLQSVPSRTNAPASPAGRSSRTSAESPRTSAESPTSYNVRPATAGAGSRVHVLQHHDAMPPRIARPDSAGWNHLVPLLQRYPAGELRPRRLVQQASVNPLSGVRCGVSPSEAELDKAERGQHINAVSRAQRRRADEARQDKPRTRSEEGPSEVGTLLEHALRARS